MRTTVNLDDDIYEAAHSLARAEEKSIGKVLSELARRGLAPLARRDTTVSRFPTFEVSADAPPLTPEIVARAENDE